MNFWKGITIRWSSEELKKWTSLRKTAYLLLPLLFYFVVHDAVQILLWALVEVILSRGSSELTAYALQNSGSLQGIINGLAILIGVAVIWQAVKGEISYEEENEELSLSSSKKKESVRKKAAEGKTAVSEKQVTSYMFLAGLAFSTSMCINIFFYQIGFTARESFQRVYEMQYGVEFIIGIVLYGVLSPLAEEAVFRGLIYNRMKRCFGFPIALLGSALLFGCYHGNLVQAVYGTLLGLLIAYLYERYKSFAAPVLFHGVANVSVYVLTYGNQLAGMDKKAAIGAAAFLLLFSVWCFWYILKKICPKE